MTRLFDIIFSLLAILILLPFMIPIMILLKMTGEHRIFYLQARIGQFGKEFHVVKFATMLNDSPNMKGGFITLKDDPRLLPMGSFLRKTKINELPQLANIFIGQMSFVGPRPNVKKHLDYYPEAIKEEILRLKPGLTGIGSLVFRDEEGILDKAGGDREEFYQSIVTPYKAKLELWYTNHLGLRTYFPIIFLTAWSVLSAGSLVYKKIFKDLPKVPEKLALFL